MKRFDNEIDECHFTELPVCYDLKIYNENCDDFLDVSLITEVEPCGKETQKTIHFIQVLLENNVRFSLEPTEGGKWWNSHYEEYKEYMSARKQLKTAGGDEN